MCVPQRLYSSGAGQNDPKNKLALPFILEDGSYLPVTMALGRQYTGLIDRDSQVLVENGDTVMIRMEVKNHISLRDTLMFIGCSVAGISVERVSSESVEIVLPERC